MISKISSLFIINLFQIVAVSFAADFCYIKNDVISFPLTNETSTLAMLYEGPDAEAILQITSCGGARVSSKPAALWVSERNINIRFDLKSESEDEERCIITSVGVFSFNNKVGHCVFHISNVYVSP